jgi:RNA polymerase sigma-70 factor
VARALTAAIVERLYEKARANRWGIAVEEFAIALDASVAYAAERQQSFDINRYTASLHLEDLALAVACTNGIDAAWEHFILEFRPILYRAADAIDPSGGSRDLADSLYADLYGLIESRGERQSLFRYFHGRSSLATWLRAVIAQRYVDRKRLERRFDPLPEDDVVPAPAAAEPEPFDREEQTRYMEVLRLVLSAAMAGLPARDRLRLGCYYVQSLTLAEIGRALGEHEGTVSRHLARTRKRIRDEVERRLRDEHGFDAASISECLRSVTDDSGTLDLRELIGDTGRKKRALDRSR